MPRYFGNWLAEYMNYTRNSEAPDTFHFWTGVSTIAGALRRRVWIDQRHFKWIPNFYIIFVAPPGVATKSTCISTGMALLSDIDDIVFGPNSMTWQGLSVALSESKKVYPIGTLGDEFLQMSCLTIPISELGTFLKPKETDLIDFLVDMWDGKDGTWRHRIKTGDNPSTEIVNPWINIIGCTTPAWLRGNFPMYMLEGGLTSRCIFVFADRKRHLVPYPSEMIITKEYIEHGRKLKHDLMEMANLLGEYYLSADALAWGKDWYAKHWGTKSTKLLSEKYSGYIARKQTHIHKLAIVLAAARSNKLIIEQGDLELAEKLITSLEGDIERVFKSIGASDDSRAMAELLAVIRAAGRVSAGVLWSKVMATVDRKDFDNALIGLENAGIIQRILLGEAMHYQLVPGSDIAGYS